MVFNLHAPLSMEGFCRIACYGWCLQGVVNVLTLNKYRFLLFYCCYFKPQSCRVIKKEKFEKPVSRREHASKETCFLLFLIHPVVHHSLSFSISPPFFSSLSHLYLSGEWVCSVHQCGLLWRVTSFLHRQFIMYEHGRSAGLRQDVRDAILPPSPQIQFRHDYIMSQNTFQNKSVSNSASDVSTPTAVTPILLQ